ncbi:TetR/AcrR family transcriptional regulator [Alteromonas pelagimontana]|uniref:TetR/AcrR family transcriptional regulator n=1 Tax=Alteromonas pelagimontana TaxID=1858656 RepID=A0A6M4MB86_9ALTE|nr:TetR/AcrR family transcriptional regulator [Alteromonas pelagimontana]QJR79815.1 TetR/AcrR family transcriptional regulator [Alteromonas pelagimontana]
MATVTRTRSDVKREAIICAAKQAFQKYGVAGTSMDRLAEMANVSKRTVYNHFNAKEVIVMHLIKALWQKSMVSIPVQYDNTTPLEDQLSAILLAEIELITGSEYLELARVAFGHFFYHPDRLRDEVEQLTAQETVLHKWLKSARDDGTLTLPDLEYSVKELSSLIKGHCFWPQLMKIEPPISLQGKKKVATQTALLFLSHYRA